jgi:hypothetical protein
MKVNLFINYYIDKNPIRQKELDKCLKENINNKQIDCVYIFVDKDTKEKLRANDEIISENTHGLVMSVAFEGRPTYNDYFKLTQQYPDDINIIANSDITIEQRSLSILKNWDWKNYCLALSRWDLINDNMQYNRARHYNHSDSQDVWIRKGAFPLIKEANFTLGIAGCDNKIAHLLKDYFTVINPSNDIKTFHYHISGVRNYKNEKGHVIHRLPPPYHRINCTNLPR